MKKGDISLGVGDKLYEGTWLATEGRVAFSFAEKLPAPINSNRVAREYQGKWNDLTPYELGGKIVNEILEAKK